MYIVNIEGDDPFIAADEGAIYRGLDDLHDGKTIDAFKTAHGFRLQYETNNGQQLNIVAIKTEIYT